MTRMTAAERRAREAEQQAAELAQLEADYRPRLMAFLEQASELNCEIEVSDGAFQVTDHDDCNNTWRLDPGYSMGSLAALNWAESELEEKLERRREAERLIQVRKTALAKLSDEERAALGL